MQFGVIESNFLQMQTPMTLIALQGKYTVDSINNVSAYTLMQITFPNTNTCEDKDRLLKATIVFKLVLKS